MKEKIKPLSKNNSGQMIIIMGFVLVVGVLVVASMTANLSNIGTDVPKIHSDALLPEFINIHEKFSQSLQGNFEGKNSIESCFNKTYDFFFKEQASKGRYFKATLNDYYYGGTNYAGAVYYVSVTSTLYDGNTNITKDTVFIVNSFN